MTENIRGEDGNTSAKNMDKGPSTPAGSLLYMVDGKRQLKAYVLTEDNLDSLSVLDSIFNICLAVGSALLSFAGGIWLSLSLAGDTVSSNIKSPWIAFFVVCLALGIVCVYFCIWSFSKRKGSIQKIKEETKHSS